MGVDLATQCWGSFDVLTITRPLDGYKAGNHPHRLTLAPRSSIAHNSLYPTLRSQMLLWSKQRGSPVLFIRYRASSYLVPSLPNAAKPRLAGTIPHNPTFLGVSSA